MLLAHRITYGTIAIGLVMAGVIGFVLPFGFFDSIATGFDQEQLHLAQEASAGAIAIGFLAAWCAFHYEQSLLLQYIVLSFFALFAILHWIDHLQDHRALESGLVNSVPAATLLLLMMRYWLGRPIAQFNEEDKAI